MGEQFRKLPQTNRTILFDKIAVDNKDKSLYNLLNKMDAITYQNVNEINNLLLVDSFDDFLDKFKPCIYYKMIVDKDTGKKKFEVSLEKPDRIPNVKCEIGKDCFKIELNKKSDYLKIFLDLLDRKNTLKKNTYEFDSKEIIEKLAPSEAIKKINNFRAKIHFNLIEKIKELPDGTLKKEKLQEQLRKELENFVDSNIYSPLDLMVLSINDHKKFIKTDAKTNENSQINTNFVTGTLVFSEKGFEIKELPESTIKTSVNNEVNQEQKKELTASYNFENQMITVDKTNEIDNLKEEKSDLSNLDPATSDIIEFTKKIYKDKVGDSFNPNLESLLVRGIFPEMSNIARNNVDKEEKISSYNHEFEVYSSLINEIIEKSRPLIQKILDIKLFFEQSSNNKKIKLLITNSSVKELLEEKDKLKHFFNLTNKSLRSYDDIFWFGIIPNVELEDNFDYVDYTKPSTIEEVEEFLNILSDYKIQTFISFQANDKTTFNDLVVNQNIDKYSEKLENILNNDDNPIKEYLIPCIPNFQILSEDLTEIELGNIFKIESNAIESTKTIYLNLGNLFIDSSYIAAGLAAAWQDSSFLDSKGIKAIKGIPGVRFNIEKVNNNQKIHTTLAKEVLSMPQSFYKNIKENNFGVIFDSSYENISIYSARSLEKSKEFTEIYKTTSTNYIYRILTQNDEDNIDEIEMSKYLGNNPDLSYKSEWLKNKEYENSILQDKDEIKIITEDDVIYLDIKFNSDSKKIKLKLKKR